MPEDIIKAAQYAREEEAEAERKLQELETAADAAEATFREGPSAKAHTDAAVARQVAVNARTSLVALRASHAEIFAAEKRELMRAELEAVRPRHQVQEAVERLNEVLATFRRDAKAATKALRETIAKRNVDAGRATELARQLGLAEEFAPIRLADIVTTMNAATAPTGALEPAHQGSSHIVLGGSLDNPTHFNFTAKFGV